MLLNRVVATPNVADPYRRHHPGARRAHASESTSQAHDKGSLTRATLMPNGDYLYMAPGEKDIAPDHQMATARPGSGIYRPTTSRPSARNGFEPLERTSSNPNPVLHEREQWAFPATDRLSKFSLRSDPANRLFSHAGVNVETTNVSFLGQVNTRSSLRTLP